MPLAGPLEFTRAELLRSFGKKDKRNGEKPLTDAHIDAIEAKQLERNPKWKPGDKLLVHWQDIADATGAVARPGDF